MPAGTSGSGRRLNSNCFEIAMPMWTQRRSQRISVDLSTRYMPRPMRWDFTSRRSFLKRACSAAASSVPNMAGLPDSRRAWCHGTRG
ncbi:twin-arginine translocation signal domain-containing protein [Stutzerimonas nitrititolerans]|uniref:twin-arginine translocation signal domain-containing protein n=1 Tax=Stutzerimonas nitrititolerans TaxID=2482751 RepID=UPI0035E3EF69